MLIGTNYSLSASLALPAASPAPGATSGGAGGLGVVPAFGPAAQVSLGERVPSFTGFTDYTSLGGSGLWQFDLAAVLNPQASAVPRNARSPEEQKADAAAVKQALALVEEGQVDEARKLMQDLLAQDRTNAAALYVLASADLEEHKYATAEQLYLKAHALDPTAGYDNDARSARILQQDDGTVLARARALLTSPAQRRTGIQLLMVLTERTPDDTAAHLLLGEALLDEQDGLNGLLQYDAALRTARPGELHGIAQRLGELADAAPQSAFLRQLVGKAQIRQGRFAAALDSLRLANQIAGDTAGTQRDMLDALLGFGRQLLRRGELTAALTRFREARDLSPANRDAKIALAEGYIAQAERLTAVGDYQAAASTYAQAVDLLGESGPQDLRRRAAAGAFALGRTLENRRVASGGEIGSELVAYQAAHDLEPDNLTYRRRLAQSRNALGDELTAAGNLKDAAYSYKRAWELCRNDATYKANTVAAFLSWGDEASFNLRYDDAVTAFREAYTVDLTNADNKRKLAVAYNTRGLDHYANQRMAKAAADFKEALELFPDDPEYQANFELVRGWWP
ncbi:MAG: tetratricopeptide repeat protein [Planctomycetota bacterium]